MTFMDVLNRVFRNYLDSFVFLFIEDILIYSKSEVEHVGHSRMVLKVPKEYQLFV